MRMSDRPKGRTISMNDDFFTFFDPVNNRILRPAANGNRNYSFIGKGGSDDGNREILFFL